MVESVLTERFWLGHSHACKKKFSCDQKVRLVMWLDCENESCNNME